MALPAGETTAALLRAIPRLRPLPDVARAVIQLLQDPEYSIDELIAIVRTDATLVARILRLCNSARSGLGREIRAIGEAVAFLGSRHLVQLVLATCSASTFAPGRGAGLVDGNAAWRHSVTTAVLGSRLAHGLDPVTQASAFTVGVLHGIGALALDLVAGETGLLAAELTADPLTHEPSCSGLDHGTVAGLVAAAWQLPGNVTRALAGHHDDTVLAADDPLPAVLHVADRLAARWLAGVEPGATTAPAALQRLALPDSVCDSVVADAKGDLAAMAELLNLTVRADR